MAKAFVKHDYAVTGRDYVETEGGDTPAGGGLDYSTEEQDTGRKWIDGSTIYVKSWIWDSPITIAANNATTLTSSGVTIADGKCIINAEVVSTIDKRTYSTFYVGYSGSDIEIYNPVGSAIALGALTLYYTKTE